MIVDVRDADNFGRRRLVSAGLPPALPPPHGNAVTPTKTSGGGADSVFASIWHHPVKQHVPKSFADKMAKLNAAVGYKAFAKKMRLKKEHDRIVAEVSLCCASLVCCCDYLR